MQQPSSKPSGSRNTASHSHRALAAPRPPVCIMATYITARRPRHRPCPAMLSEPKKSFLRWTHDACCAHAACMQHHMLSTGATSYIARTCNKRAPHMQPTRLYTFLPPCLYTNLMHTRMPSMHTGMSVRMPVHVSTHMSTYMSVHLFLAGLRIPAGRSH